MNEVKILWRIVAVGNGWLWLTMQANEAPQERMSAAWRLH